MISNVLIRIFICSMFIFAVSLITVNTIDKFENNWHDKIDGIVYINLEKRDDRKKLILDELTKIETNMNKVNKVSGVYIPKNGHKGCVQSHILALNVAKLNNWKQVLIFEDDMELIVSPTEFNDAINNTLNYIKTNNISWDVILLATANATKKTSNDVISRVTGSTTSSGYIVNKEYYDKLLNLFNLCNYNMIHSKWGNTDGGHEEYALDQQWCSLQDRDNWFALNNELIKQRSSFSTINGEK